MFLENVVRKKVPVSKGLALASTPMRSQSKVSAAVASTPVRSHSKMGKAFGRNSKLQVIVFNYLFR